MRRGLTQKQRLLLLEAARRYRQFAKEGESLTQAWTGLGSATAYKPVINAGYMEVATSPSPGFSTWYRLTPKGAAIVKVLISAMTLPQIWTELEGLPKPNPPVSYAWQGVQHETTFKPEIFKELLDRRAQP